MKYKLFKNNINGEIMQNLNKILIKFIMTKVIN